MIDSNLFPQWMPAWLSESGTDKLAREISGYFRLRLQSVPARNGGRAATEVIRPVALASRNWANGTPPTNIDDRSTIAEVIWTNAKTYASVCGWKRWLLLEAALQDAMQTRDLLFTASVLRTMLEELSWLHALDLDQNKVRALAVSAEEADSVRIKHFMLATWVLMGEFTRESILAGTDFPKAPVDLLSDRALRAKRALNTFVHPNYGSHIAAIYPEGQEAARAVLEATAAIYESFYALRHAHVAPPAAPFSGGTLGSGDLLDQFEHRGLADAMRALDAISPVNPIETKELIDRLRHESLVNDLSDPMLAELLSGLPREPDMKSGVQGFRIWAGANSTDVLSMAAARRSEQALNDRFPAGTPERSDESGWLAFNLASLELAIAAADLKQRAFRTQVVRQLVRGNPIGIWLAARGTIENHAVMLWLPKVLSETMDTMTLDVAAGPHLSQVADRLARALAEFLTTGATTSGVARSWSLDPVTGRPRARISLSTVVSRAFSDDDFWVKQYDFGSAVMHGRTYRNGPIANDLDHIVGGARAQGLLILGKLIAEEIRTAAASVAQTIRLRHGAELGPVASVVGSSRWSWGWDGCALVAGRDYTGSGTMDEPYIMAPHIGFHVGSRALAGQDLGSEVLEILNPSRTEGCMLEFGPDGLFYDVWRYAGRECWIRVPFYRDPSILQT
ncbi:hypothetical protein [Mycoplana rhizolycopersici]|uniref:Uncharacterized protein n=1 Tax=Mycoplana rhizolycopersici TaxID=2746702 RepID=A0ABX2QLX1_9HYPH|nr:hypothetical protein [Rhizobium rhizolycopersici]NVP57588.1 hypothetical protein [Rhizobium rhizolycopersici]